MNQKAVSGMVTKGSCWSLRVCCRLNLGTLLAGFKCFLGWKYRTVYGLKMNNGNQCWKSRSQTEWCKARQVITLTCQKNTAGHESTSVMVHQSSWTPRPMKYERLASQNKLSCLSRLNTIIPFPGCKHSGSNATNFMLGQIQVEESTGVPAVTTHPTCGCARESSSSQLWRG